MLVLSTSGSPCHREDGLVTVSTMTLQFQKKDPRITITTKLGEIKIRLYPDAAPRHVENLVNLIKMGSMTAPPFIEWSLGFSSKAAIP